jgi:hypothetical protein
MRLRVSILFAVLMAAVLPVAHAQLSLTETSATDWHITNGTLTMDFNPQAGELWSMYLNAYSSDNLVDTTQTGGDGHPKGLYMDNDGTCMTQGIGSSATPTASYHLSSGHYLDWWISWAPNSSCPMTLTLHYVLFPNDPTVWTYYVANHASSAAEGTFGQLQYLFRISWSYFYDTYSYNSGLNNLGGWALTLPSETDLASTDPGRAVENAVEDLHGFSLPGSNWGREFYTKYDYATYEYLHQAHCVYGSQFGACTVIPSTESLEGGPMKQDLIFTENILMGELNSNHLVDSAPGYVTTGNTTRIWGPIGFQFSEGESASTMYTNAVNSISGGLTNLANDTILTEAGYVPNPASGGTARGNVEPFISGGGSSSANTAWAVLSDQFTNFQYSADGYQYWTANNANGDATIYNAVPGSYRLSAFVLGEWGELREDGITVTANSTNDLHGLTFTPENFSPSGDSPIWTIGTPNRSANEFLHGKNNYGNAGSCSGCDDREFYGNWNYWADFSANSGAVNYYATAVGSTPATNNTLDWNYVQWGVFDPGLYDSGNDTTDNYVNTIPTYVKSLPGATGTNGVTTPVPAWTVHFATTTAQMNQGSYVDLSVGLASVEGSLTVSLNGHSITWHVLNSSDAMARSSNSGYYQWIVYEWPTSDLVAAGGNNVLTFSVSQPDGVMYDALRMEISANGANPSNDKVSSNY